MGHSVSSGPDFGFGFLVFQKKVWNWSWISYINSIKHASYKRLLHFMQFHNVNSNKHHCIYFKQWSGEHLNLSTVHNSCSWLTKKHGLLFKHHFLLFCSCEKCKLQTWWPISFRGLLYPRNMILAHFCSCK